MKAKIPGVQIDPTGTIYSLAGATKYRYFFNNYADSADIGDAVARAVPSGAKVAIIGDGTANAVGLTDAFLASAHKDGVDVVKQETFSQTALAVRS
jgi:ABC-type branched-subunit amino acid transport system substrate-binding protein